MGKFASKQGERPSAINSIDVGIVDVLEDMKKLLTQDMLGVRPTELCTYRDNDLKEDKFIKSIAESTQIDCWGENPGANALEWRGTLIAEQLRSCV